MADIYARLEALVVDHANDLAQASGVAAGEMHFHAASAQLNAMLGQARDRLITLHRAGPAPIPAIVATEPEPEPASAPKPDPQPEPAPASEPEPAPAPEPAAPAEGAAS